uniref:Uncharacterized protein n=1 Tax=Octopus bimaculoides TaxID=37653 RepID=A0A0L8FMG1_OCTBM
MMTRMGLRTDPMWKPTCTLNLSLYPWPTFTLLTAPLVFTAFTSHSFIPSFLTDHHITV